MADSFRVERTETIAARPEVVFPLIDNFRSWELWSPWDKIDADLARTYSGSDHGVGAVYEWEGKKSGAGRMEITTSTPSSTIVIDLQFLKPFKNTNLTTFALEPVAGGTCVTWTMTGAHTFFSKLMGLFMNMDKMVGKDFAAGLASLKAVSETRQSA